MEKRAIPAEIRVAKESEEPKVVGLGIVYDEWTELWPGYKECIKRGAVKMAPDTVKSFFNHDPDMVLSTLDSNPALQLIENERGMEYISPIPPTTYGKDLQINLERGNVKGSSFAFDVPPKGDRIFEDENGIYHREISELVLYEIGPVTNPAYIQTSANLRSAQDAIERFKAEKQNREKPSASALLEKRQKLLEVDI